MVSLDILRPLCEGILAKKEEEGVIQMGLQALLVIVESGDQIIGKSPLK